MTILVGLSGTASGDLAIKTAIEYSQEHDRIIGIYVPPTLPVEFPGLEEDIKEMWTQRRARVTRKMLDHAEEAVKRYKNEMKSVVTFQLEVLTEHTSGSHKVAVVQACKKFKADLLILGSKGATADAVGDRKSDMSSIPTYALQQAPCSVMIVRRE
jgi:nucleotide-binding universal stress UspA family protein